MTFTVRIRTQPGAPMLCDYECPEHGVFERTVYRDANGDPPAKVSCMAVLEDTVSEDGMFFHFCDEGAERIIGAAHPKFWSRDPVAVGRASKSDERDPRALDTEPLATGKMTKPEWQKWQRGISNERRYQKRLKSGRISKRVQVGGG